MVFKIFVSYSTKDLVQVDLLKRQLADTLIEVFIAEHSVTPSQKLAPAISNAITECDIFIVIWSDNAKGSEWVPQEIGKADALGKIILPLILTEGMKLPGFISGLKYISVHKDQNQSLSQAREIILKAYHAKKAELERATQAKKDKDALVVMGIGAFLLWTISK